MSWPIVDPKKTPSTKWPTGHTDHKIPFAFEDRSKTFPVEERIVERKVIEKQTVLTLSRLDVEKIIAKYLAEYGFNASEVVLTAEIYSEDNSCRVDFNFPFSSMKAIPTGAEAIMVLEN